MAKSERRGDCLENAGVRHVAAKLLGPRAHGRQNNVVARMHALFLGFWKVALAARLGRHAGVPVGGLRRVLCREMGFAGIAGVGKCGEAGSSLRVTSTDAG